MLSRLKQYLIRGLRYTLHGIPQYNITASIHCSNPSKVLLGKKIIITGGSKGIGKALALKFVSEGADVMITGRDTETLSEVASEIGCHYKMLDMKSVDSFDDFINEASDILGGLDCLVNNAGVSLHEWDILNVTEEGYDNQFDTNLKGAYFLTKSFLKYMLPNPTSPKNILFISSERGEQADVIPYGLTKAAMNSLVHGLAKFYAGTNIRVNAIAPGVTASVLTGYSSTGNLYYPKNPSKRIYIPEEVAEVATFLLSPNSHCLSGQILVCNEAKTINSYF